MSVERVKQLLDDLEEKLSDKGTVRDPELRQRILEAHRDHGWNQDADVVIVLGKPAPRTNLAELAAVVERRFDAALPNDYLAFLKRCDGLSVCLYEDRPDVMPPTPDYFEDHAIMSAYLASMNANNESFAVTHPDGTQSVTAVPTLAFYDMAETGCHAFAFNQDPAHPPITDVDGELRWESEGDVIAPSFAVWLEAFIAAGLEPFRTVEHLSSS